MFYYLEVLRQVERNGDDKEVLALTQTMSTCYEKAQNYILLAQNHSGTSIADHRNCLRTVNKR